MRDEAAEELLRGVLLPHMQPHNALALRACMCCSTLSRALAMCGHAGWQVWPSCWDCCM